MRTLIIVSGGDAPGINTVIMRYLQWAQSDNNMVLGVQGGFAGLLANKIKPLHENDVAPLAGLGGSILASSREPVLAQQDAQSRFKEILQAHQIDNMLLFGGNGTLHYVLPKLLEWRVRTIALPTTIDNDVSGTERALGFDSACQFAYPLVEGVLATARALPGRIFLFETLGGNTGHLALAIAEGSGAHAVLVPEYSFDDVWLQERINSAISQHGHALIVLSEGIPHASKLDTKIPELTGIRVRYTRLGHAQRGANVSHIDRVLAYKMAYLAYHGFKEDVVEGMIVVRSGEVSLHTGPLSQQLSQQTVKLPDYDTYCQINGL